MTATTILAIDPGKYKCVACAYDRATAAADYRATPTPRAEVERLIRTSAPAAVVIEACALSGWVHDLCGQLGVPCRVAAYGGLVPRQFQGGEDDRRGRITERGPAALRELPAQCAWAMLRDNAWARAVFQRPSRGKARREQAVVALARRVPVRCWAVLRDGAAWRAGPDPAGVAA